jgi:hypothetical protein
MQRVFEIEHYFWEVSIGWDMNLKKLPALLSKLSTDTEGRGVEKSLPHQGCIGYNCKRAGACSFS